MSIAEAKRYRRGVRKASPVASVVAGASGTLVKALPPNRTAEIRKIRIFNHNGAATSVTFGAGLLGAFVGATEPIPVLNGMDLILTEDQIPDTEFTANITASCTVAAAAPANVEIQIETEEYLSVSG